MILCISFILGWCGFIFWLVSLGVLIVSCCVYRNWVGCCSRCVIRLSWIVWFVGVYGSRLGVEGWLGFFEEVGF